MGTRATAQLPLALALAFVAACRFGSSGTPAPPPAAPGVATATPVGTTQGTATQATIGPEGGTLVGGGGAVTLVVPAGSVGSSLQFAATPIGNRAHGGVGSAYRLEANGPLTGPVTIRFRGPTSYATGTSIAGLRIQFQDARGFWQNIDPVSRDGSANTVTVTSTHLSDWALVWGQGVPTLEGSFTLLQRVGVPFSATGTAALYRQADPTQPTYVLTGSITLPPEIRFGTNVCVPSVPTQSLDLSVAEVASANFRWGINARWGLTCTDTSTSASSSQEIATQFDTLGINLTRCSRSYVGTQVNGDDFIQGSFTTDCGTDGTVAASWDFRSCASGGVCVPANGCHTGTVTCSAGIATCTDNGNVADGASCGTGSVCAGGACVSCAAGSACTPANACHVGVLDCSAGPVCLDTGVPVTDGASCGLDAVCGGGTCNSCQPGAACVSANPCHTAALTCNTGFPVCTDTGPATNGTTCGSNLVCSEGACVGCVAGQSCTPTNACHAGTLSCTAGPVCNDAGTPLTDGTSCGTNAVCGAGACNACTVGADCPPPSGDPCHTASYTCNTGVPVCTESAGVFASDGKSCGADKVCSSGSCVDCTVGAKCTPTNPCDVGSQSCSAGPVCVDTATPIAAGASCGTNQVCTGTGNCVACTEGKTCTPSDPCKTGADSCSSGGPVCTVNGDAPNGTSCGAGAVCAAGACVACAEGSSCTPANACLQGTLSCSGGPVCQATVPTTPVGAGTSCGTAHVCDGAGVCVSCNAGESCTPSQACALGVTACSSGTPVCNVTGPAADGTTTGCAAGEVCTGGACVACQPGAACTPSNPCFDTGTLTCTAGLVCTPGPQLPAGTSCGTGQVCDPTGTCISCTADASCAPVDPCKTGAITCSSGDPVCAVIGNAADGTPCVGGVTGTCLGGVCQ